MSDGRSCHLARYMEAFRSARKIGADPGDINPATTAELIGEGPGRRPRISLLSRRYYERRTRRTRFNNWEAERRQNVVKYAEAIRALSAAGSWSSTSAETVDAMLAALADGWTALMDELVRPVERAKMAMVRYRKRRMVLDQVATRFLEPATKKEKSRPVIMGYGKATFASRGPRLQLLRAFLRRMKDMRRRGIPTAMVFIDEFRTTITCQKCLGITDDMRTSVNHRFRGCRSCGEEKAPKLWGRDSNAALNILRKLELLLRGEALPAALTRQGCGGGV